MVIPEHNLDPANENPFRFKIRHVKKSVDTSLQLTRVFSCNKESRDDWVYAINHALLEYEKEKANARRLSGLLTLSPPRWRRRMAEDVSPDMLRRRQPPNLVIPPVPSLS